MAYAASYPASSLWTLLTSFFFPDSPAPRTVVLASWRFTQFKFVTMLDIRSRSQVYRLHSVFAGLTAEEFEVLLEKIELLSKRDAVLELRVVDDPDEGEGVSGRIVELKVQGSREALYHE